MKDPELFNRVMRSPRTFDRVTRSSNTFNRVMRDPEDFSQDKREKKDQEVWQLQDDYSSDRDHRYADYARIMKKKESTAKKRPLT